MKAVGRMGSDSLGQTKRRIIEIAGDLFSEKTYLGVSMSDIADRLGIAKPTLYHHFSSKSEIYSEVLDDVLGGLKHRLDRATAGCSSPPERLRNLVRVYLEFGLQEKNLLCTLAVRLSRE
jgi:AcrR family transcriptional regulator